MMRLNTLVCSGRRVSMGVWGLARILISPMDAMLEPFFLQLTDTILRAKDNFTIQGVSNIMWSYSTMFHLKTTNSAGAQCFAHLSPPLSEHCTELFLSLSERAVELLPTSNQQGLSNLAWAVARAQIDITAPRLAPCRQLMLAIAARMRTIEEAPYVQNVAMLAWAFNIVPVLDREQVTDLFQYIQDQMQAQSLKLDPCDITVLHNAFRQVGVEMTGIW